MHVEVINGLLGAGKTTILLNLLENKTDGEKVAVLVNEFGEIGIDGDLLGGQGADVVELPNGCICCTLNADLKKQIGFIADTYHPDKLFIEPTGVATIKNLMGILTSLTLEKYIDDISVNVVVDASTFEEILAQNRGFVETQIEKADAIIVNKCDRVTPAEINKIRGFISNINNCPVVLTVFGRPMEDVKSPGMSPGHNKSKQDKGSESIPGHNQIYEEHHHEEHHHEGHELPLKKYEQFSRSSSGTFDPKKIRNLFLKINNGQFGWVDRAKGLFYISGDRWLHMDLASHEISESLPEQQFKSSKIMAVGTGLLKEALKKEFDRCLIK